MFELYRFRRYRGQGAGVVQVYQWLNGIGQSTAPRSIELASRPTGDCTGRRRRVGTVREQCRDRKLGPNRCQFDSIPVEKHVRVNGPARKSGRRILFAHLWDGLLETVCIGWGSVGLDWIGLDWIRLDLDWIGLDWIGWDGMGWDGMGWDWMGWDWIGLGWIGWDWVGLDWIGIKRTGQI